MHPTLASHHTFAIMIHDAGWPLLKPEIKMLYDCQWKSGFAVLDTA